MIDYSKPDCKSEPEDPYAEGWEAAEKGKDQGDNPYDAFGSGCSQAYALWDKGFVAKVNK